MTTEPTLYRIDEDLQTDEDSPRRSRWELEAVLEEAEQDRRQCRVLRDWDHAVTAELIHAASPAENGVLPTDAEVARFGVALDSWRVFEALWMQVDDGRLRGRALWIDLSGRLPDWFAARPLFLLAWRAFRDGDSDTAEFAAGRAHRYDPTLTGAAVLLRGIDDGLDPRTLPLIAEGTQSRMNG